MIVYGQFFGAFYFAYGGLHNGQHIMNDIDRIREQIKRMRCKDVEPECVYVCLELYHHISTKDTRGVPIEYDDKLKTGFEVR